LEELSDFDELSDLEDPSDLEELSGLSDFDFPSFLSSFFPLESPFEEEPAEDDFFA